MNINFWKDKWWNKIKINNIKELIIFDISKNKKEFVVKIMNLLENWANSEQSDYLCGLSDFEKVNLWLEMSDLDLISWSKKRGEKNFKN